MNKVLDNNVSNIKITQNNYLILFYGVDKVGTLRQRYVITDNAV